MTLKTSVLEKEKINRRTFFRKSANCTAGLALLTFPGLIREVRAQTGDHSQNESLKEMENKVNAYMQRYRSCALASFALLNEQFKLKAEHVIPALMPFTGGIAMRAETCGAVSGSVLALGFFFEPADKTSKKKPGSSIGNTGKFFDRFTKEFSSTRCREIQKHQYGRSYNFLDPVEQKEFVEVSLKTGKCLEVVKKAVLIAGDIILSKP
jgi:C_GCAxxG_C_C family probable redox protein